MALKSNLQRKYGVKSDIASDGAEAIEMIQKNSYSLVLNGYRFARYDRN